MSDDAAGNSSGVGSALAFLGLVFFIGSAGDSLAAEPEGSIVLDCGLNSLYVLHKLEGHPVTLDLLNSILPLRQHDGYSMTELMEASKSLGLAWTVSDLQWETHRRIGA